MPRHALEQFGGVSGYDYDYVRVRIVAKPSHQRLGGFGELGMFFVR
jgi:hypothetical protein